MTVPVRKTLVQSKKHKIKCPYPMKAEYITVHNTANDASANNEVQYMINNSNQVSYHFAVDDKEVVQGTPLDRNAWHAGDGNGNGNRKSIGIEICYSKSGGTRYYQAEGLAIQFIAQLLKERRWGIERVKKHQDWSGKKCPHRILDEGRWQSFLHAIKEELSKMEDDDLNFSSPSLKEVTEFSLGSRAHRKIIVDAAIKAGASETWLEKLENNEITDDDLKGLAIMYTVNSNK